MSYQCPRCGRDLKRCWRKRSCPAGDAAVAVRFAVVSPFLPRYRCPKHGTIDPAEFSPAVRRRMWLPSIVGLATTVVGLTLLIWLLRKAVL